MQTLSQYLKTARKDYTHACVSVPCIKRVSGDIDFVSEYFQNDLFGNHLILAGYFNPGGSRVRGHFVTCVCTYRKENKMKQDEEMHAEKIEQTLVSINTNLERIAKSLEKMEPTVYKLPKFDVPLNDPDISVPADKFLRTITADESAKIENPAESVKNPAENDSKPRYCHDAGVTYMYWSNNKGCNK